MLVKVLNTLNPEYDPDLLTKYELLYEGGNSFLKQVTRFLPKRNSEASKVYNERISRAFYVGYAGLIVDYFVANLFAMNASINKDKDSAPFFDSFLQDCDLKGTEFNSFFKEVFTKTLVHRKSFILIDFPRKSDDVPPPLSLKEEEEMGLTRSYLVHFHKSELYDWEKDTLGNFEWVKFHCKERYKPFFDSEDLIRHTWYIYDKENYKIFQYDEDPKKTVDESLQSASLVASGNHYSNGRVPVYCVEVPKGLWIMNKLASIQTELFNLDNALAWQEYQSHYAMPIIKLEDGNEFKQRMGESYYIKLRTTESFEWTEPEGRLMEVGLKRREMLKDEMYRIVLQMSLSVKQTKTQTKQSGSSKQEDRYATEVILRAFGDIIRENMQNILNQISLARKDGVTFDVSGFSTFDMDSRTEKLAQYLQAKALGVPSETFRREVDKQVGDLFLEDANAQTKDQVKKDLDNFDYQALIDDPLMIAVQEGAKAQMVVQENSTEPSPQGTTKPTQQPQAPNGVNREAKKTKQNSKASKSKLS